ncbi:hypothetical protein BHF71_08055 [Vulcanibacillus modesticaldus]|uniref:YaaC-like Protein n=1 Tax=Vulcanibacillus modesticaldus TaxID=337097 RepID=A0A1D2YV89_9BACI|nr:YaaC family protein [Vulcanibacillus modesticaldus]OEF99634.1 hypothetical protein BHF71_08055 [Vulcanibacillus modesticaldus]
MKKIHRIHCENPYEKMWDTYVFFESEPSTKKYLQNIYEKIGYDDGYKLAYQNTPKFIYFIKQAKEYFYSASKSNILVKPLLIYYGMMNFIKAVILTKKPDYPSRTSVLRHGITTRKLKKNNFQLHDDEVKIQKDGLLPLFYTLITDHSVEIIEGNKYKLKELLSLIPELNESYSRLFQEETIFPIYLKQITPTAIELNIPRKILSFYDDDINKFCKELNDSSNKEKNQFSLDYDQRLEFFTCIWNGNLENPLNIANFFDNQMIIQDIKGQYFIRPINDRRLLLPELMIDYMIMYNLGMLCRYDTELWGEIIFSFVSEDMYIVNEFLNLSLRKFPNLILNVLFDEKFIFEIN